PVGVLQSSSPQPRRSLARVNLASLAACTGAHKSVYGKIGAYPESVGDEVAPSRDPRVDVLARLEGQAVAASVGGPEEALDARGRDGGFGPHDVEIAALPGFVVEDDERIPELPPGLGVEGVDAPIPGDRLDREGQRGMHRLAPAVAGQRRARV